MSNTVICETRISLSHEGVCKAEIEDVKEALSDTELCFSQYDDVMVRRLVGLIRVMKDKSIVIYLKGGLSITEQVE